MQTDKFFGVGDRQLEPNILSIVNGVIVSIFFCDSVWSSGASFIWIYQPPLVRMLAAEIKICELLLLLHAAVVASAAAAAWPAVAAAVVSLY